MANKYWYGGYASNEGEYDEANNWIDIDTGATGLPGAGDNLYFDARAYWDSANGRRQDLDDFTGQAVFQFANIYISSGYDGRIGLVSAPFRFYLTGDLICEGSGINYLSVYGSASDLTVARAILNHTGTLYLDCVLNNASWVGIWTEIIHLAGTTYLNNDAGEGGYATTIIMLGGTLYGDDDAWRHKATVAYTTFIQSGGTINWEAGINTIKMYGGTFNWGTTTQSPAADDVKECTLLEMFNGGTFNWLGPDADSTQVPTVLKEFSVIGSGASLVATSATNADIEREIGTASDETSELIFGSANFKGPANVHPNHADNTIRVWEGTLTIPSSEVVAW